jgi:putative addiction module component (TIGR02574 family)
MPVTVKSLGIDRLPVDEQLALVREIWDGILAAGARPSLSESQLQDLRRRVAEDDADPDNLIPWEEVKARCGAGHEQPTIPYHPGS